MRQSLKLAVIVVASLLAGCGFKAGTGSQVSGGSGGAAGGPQSSATGGAGSSGTGGRGTGGAVVAGTGGRTGGDIGFGTGGATCGQTNVSVTPQPPNILIVQDRSLSMTDDSSGRACAGGSMNGDGKCGAASKWAQVINALDPVVMQTQSTVSWGLMFLGDEPAACGAATMPVVPITPSTSYARIQAALAGVQFTGASGTPTAAVVNSAVQYMQGLTDPNPKFLLLATDGEPNCAGGNLNTNDDVGAENAVAAAKAAGIPTFVVGIATSTDAAATKALNTMAVNGGEAQVGAATQYYAVTDTADLLTVLAKIISAATPCTIPLSGITGSLDKVAVSAKDAAGQTVEIRQDDTNGWSYTDATKTAIILNGDACKNLQTVTYTAFQFIYTCSTGIICIDNCPGQNGAVSDAGRP